MFSTQDEQKWTYMVSMYFYSRSDYVDAVKIKYDFAVTSVRITKCGQ